MLWRVRHLVALGACLLIAGGCSRESNNNGTATDAAAIQQAREQIKQRIATANPLQQKILEDGFVSLAEADEAAGDVIACSKAGGLSVDAHWDSSQLVMVFSARVDNQVEKKNTYDQCWRDRFQLVGEALALQNAYSTEQRERLERLMIDCLTQAGQRLSKWPTDGVDPAAESSCYDQVSPTVR